MSSCAASSRSTRARASGQGFSVPHGQTVALGSGFIIDPSGYIVTNNHVVDHADKVTVIFQDDSRHPAKVIGRDPKTDLALLKIDAKEPLPYVSWGDSGAVPGRRLGAGGRQSLRPGRHGQPRHSSRRAGRDIHAGPYDDFLQIDASINRGNSGGPTFNLNGQVIGINTAIYSPNGGSVGIGFAIPSNLAKPVIEQLQGHGKVQRGWIGVQIQDVTPEIAKSLGLPRPRRRARRRRHQGRPGREGRLQAGRRDPSFNGHDIAKVRDLPIAVAQTPVGDKAEVKVWRKGSPITLQPVIAAMPNDQKMAKAETPAQARQRQGPDRPCHGAEARAADARSAPPGGRAGRGQGRGRDRRSPTTARSPISASSPATSSSPSISSR